MSLETAITGLVSRLESVAARLEKVEGQLAAGGGGGGGAPAAAATSGGAGGADASAWYAGLAAFVDEHAGGVIASGNKVGSANLKKQLGVFQGLVGAFKDFMNKVATCKKPADSDFPALLKDISGAVTEVIAIRDGARGDESWNHLSALSELAPGFGWVSITPTPAPYWKEYMGNSQFYSNKIIREFKGKNDDQMAFVNSLHAFQKEMWEFIKKNHTTNLVWNAKGGDAKASASAPAAATPKGPGGPPPPMPKEPLVAKTPAKSGGGGAGALFAEINKGGAITSGLKKVEKSQMTHKNPSLRAGSAVPASVPKKKAPAKKFGGAAKKGTPKFELSGNKWVVDFQDDRRDLEINDPLVKHTVYMYKCDKTTLKVNGKVNAITLDGCKKCAIVFTDVVASVELVNCSGVEVQAIGSVPSFAVDKCSTIQLVLSEACLKAEVVSAKSDQINVVLPPENAQADILELAVPEQIKTVVEGRALKSSFVEHV